LNSEEEMNKVNILRIVNKFAWYYLLSMDDN